MFAAAFGAALCATLAAPALASVATTLFRIADSRIAEASGIAPGRVSPGVVYMQNDSGDTNRFFALDVRTGATAATVTVTGARNVDWEDIAVGPGAGGRSSVWLADTGDNTAGRDEVQVYRVAEPRLPAGRSGVPIRTAKADIWRLRYPGGAVDAESLAVAPDGTAYIFTKTLGTSTVYRLPARPDADRVQTLHRVGQVPLLPTGTANPFGLAGQVTATGASISSDGRLLVVRTYADAYVWRLRDADVATALRGPPVRAALPEQPQGEGICVRDGRLLLSSEGVHSAVLAVPVPPGAPPAGAATSRASATTSSTPPTSVARPTSDAATSVATPTSARPSGHPSWVGPGLGVAAVALLGAAWLLVRRRR
ncbi:MAG: hypothetical protein ABR571_00970 [Jatrophihabitans sp.]|uniref:hypothetical protein n=1 Tax=Jatrophihabitans sp. TaxID=1932789 RepID=UPI00391123E0